MSRLTEKQRKFVAALLETGGTNETAAARIAGYSQTNPNGCAVEGSRLMRDQKILDAIKEEAEKRIKGGVLLGASVLVEIAADQMHKDRLRAAQALLDRGGMMVVNKSEHNLIIEDKRSEAELISFISAQARLHGMDPSKLLGFEPPDVIDGEFAEIDEEYQKVRPLETEFVEPDL